MSAQQLLNGLTPAALTVKEHDQKGQWYDQPHALGDAATAIRFMEAGNAYFTLRSAKTGVRYTYRMSKADCRTCGDGPCVHRPRWFVSLLSGPDNTTDYVYIGMVQDGEFKRTKASKMAWDSLPVLALQWVLHNLYDGKMPPQAEIWHEGRCGRCGRRLTVPESIAAGLGPDCAGKMGVTL